MNIDQVQVEIPSAMRLRFVLWAKMSTVGLHCRLRLTGVWSLLSVPIAAAIGFESALFYRWSKALFLKTFKVKV